MTPRWIEALTNLATFSRPEFLPIAPKKDFFIHRDGATEVPGGMIYPSGGTHSQLKYAEGVGTGLQSSVLMAVVNWIQRNFPQAPAKVFKKGKEETEVIGHRMIDLLEQPNDAYSGVDLLSSLIYSWIADGSAYALKIRSTSRRAAWNENVTGEVQQLWYAPHWTMEPVWPKDRDSNVFISHYEYRPDGATKIDVARENVIHFRNGIDPRNTRKGLSLIESELREIFTDDEAAAFTATVLKNTGVIGIVLTPEGPNVIPDTDIAKALLMQKHTGTRRGEPFVGTVAMKLQEYGFSPQQMDLSTIRNVVEERVTAKLGIPAAVVGFGTGIQQTKVGATMDSLEKQAWVNGVIPMQGRFASQWKTSLLSEFEPDPKAFEVRYDVSRVPAMQENQLIKVRAAKEAVTGSLITVGEARKKLGEEVGPEHDVFLVPSTYTRVSAKELATIPEPVEPTDEPPKDPPIDKSYRAMKLKLLKAAGASADERFLAIQGPLERKVTPLIAALFQEDATAIQEALADNLPKERKEDDWLERILGRSALKWTTLLREDVILEGIKRGNELLADEIFVGISYELIDSDATQYAAARAGTAIKEITDTTLTGVRAVLKEATENGWGLDKTSKAIAKLYEGFEGNRSMVIARTETASAMNWGKFHSAKETARRLEIKINKTWLAVNDSRTRPSHSGADGQTVPLDDLFTVGSTRMKFPGDPSAPPEEVIACRCTTSTVEATDE